MFSENRQKSWSFWRNIRFWFLFCSLAPARIRQYFPDSLLFLEVVADPEAGSRDDDMLWIYIDRGDITDSEEAIDTLEQIDDDEWWLDAEPRAKEKMFFNLN